MLTVISITSIRTPHENVINHPQIYSHTPQDNKKLKKTKPQTIPLNKRCVFWQLFQSYQVQISECLWPAVVLSWVLSVVAHIKDALYLFRHSLSSKPNTTFRFAVV